MGSTLRDGALEFNVSRQRAASLAAAGGRWGPDHSPTKAMQRARKGPLRAWAGGECTVEPWAEAAVVGMSGSSRNGKTPSGRRRIGGDTRTGARL